MARLSPSPSRSKTLNPEPGTLDPRPQTLNPKLFPDASAGMRIRGAKARLQVESVGAGGEGRPGDDGADEAEGDMLAGRLTHILPPVHPPSVPLSTNRSEWMLSCVAFVQFWLGL